MLWLSQASGACPSSLFETTGSSVSGKNDLAFSPRLPLMLLEDALMIRKKSEDVFHTPI